jgi:DNA mismatch repair protein MutH
MFPVVDPAAPNTVQDLLLRAQGLAGQRLGEIAAQVGVAASADGVRTKGKFGQILELALGATGKGATHDFEQLGIELKSIPIGPRGPVESTYVCTLPLSEASALEWEDSWVRRKLSRVLWVPISDFGEATWQDRRVGAPLLWSPTPAQQQVLKADFDDIVGAVGAGQAEGVTARLGRWLQLRPKAAHSGIKTTLTTEDGERLRIGPKGFYLRTLMTRAILQDPKALPSPPP